MANNITQRIALEGADTIKQAFADLGRTGAEAFASLGQAASGVAPQLEEVKKSFSDFGSSIGNSLKAAGAGIAEFSTQASKIAAAALAAGGALFALTKSAADSA